MSERPRLSPAMADIRRAVRDSWDLLNLYKGSTVAVACSGGADSLALASAVLFEGQRADVNVIACIVNHNLQEGSMEVALRTKGLLTEMGFSVVDIMDVVVQQNSLGMEAAARNARYGALTEFAQKHNAAVTMLGHTQDDQAETVLLGLARGSGAKSIAGMPTLSPDGKYLRPLLGITRKETVSYCEDLGLNYWSDPQNLDTKFSRVKARLKVLPVLEEELGPGIAQALSRTAEILQDDISYLEAQADKAFREVAKTTNNSVIIDTDLFEKLPKALANRVIHKSLSLMGAEPAKVQIDSVMELVTNWHGQKPLTLPSVRVERKGKEIILKSTKTMKPGAC
ncbi:MAG: tRNA lysidine(34) synthetase TilS [Rhodoluna sp.]|nr:tRNA lysidine(34) synthetase TilS [Rhodoluna sp.]